METHFKIGLKKPNIVAVRNICNKLLKITLKSYLSIWMIKHAISVAISSCIMWMKMEVK